MSVLLVPLAGKNSKKLSREPRIASVIIAVFGGFKIAWPPKSCASLRISLEATLSAITEIHCAVIVSSLILSLLLAELLRQSVLCRLHRGLERCGPDVLNLKTSRLWISCRSRSLRYTLINSYNTCCRIQWCWQQSVKGYSRKTLAVSLVPLSSLQNWIKCMPKSLLKREGDDIQYQIQVLLKKELSTLVCARSQVLSFQVD